MKHKKMLLTVMALFLICGCTALCVFVRGARDGQARQRAEHAELFMVYQPYGLAYDAKTDRLYYQGELVRYFEDRVDEDHLTLWPNRDGALDVHALRNGDGTLTGIAPFDEQAYADRTPELQDALYELQITENIDGYTDETEEMVKDRIEAVYAAYETYGLTYDRQSDRLYYKGKLVGYFEDAEKKYFFGPYEDSGIEVRAVRDSQGTLTGLDVQEEEKQ